MLKQVQHDRAGKCHSEFISESQIRPRVQYDNLFAISVKLWAPKIFVRTRPQLKKQFALGRSMMEMLGVLAIVGVLSIAGLAVYRQAINSYYANQFIDFINKLQFNVIEQCNEINSCPFNSDAKSNRLILCKSIPNMDCSATSGGTAAVIPNLPITWSFYKGTRAAIYFYNTPSAICQKIVRHNYYQLFSIRVTASNSSQLTEYAENGVLDDIKKSNLASECAKQTNAQNIILYWTTDE